MVAEEEEEEEEQGDQGVLTHLLLLENDISLTRQQRHANQILGRHNAMCRDYIYAEDQSFNRSFQ